MSKCPIWQRTDSAFVDFLCFLGGFLCLYIVTFPKNNTVVRYFILIQLDQYKTVK